MSAVRRFVLRLWNFLHPWRAERQLERELGAHRAMLEDEFQRRGMTREQARVAATRALGGVDRVMDVQRDARSFLWLEDARRDLVYAARTLGRTPGFTFLAVLTLALGIGSVTVIYSVIHDVLLDPLPYPGSERFVNVHVHDTKTGRSRRILPAAEFLDYQEQSQVFEDVVGTRGQSMLLETPDGAEVLNAVLVTPNFFAVMGLKPLVGRAIGPDDARPDSPPVAVLRHRAWVSYFGSDPGVVGRMIRLDGEPRTIVGVMPPRFTWHAADLWIPRSIDRNAPDARTALRNFQARLKPGVTLEQAEAQLNVIAARRARAHPDEYPENFHVRVVNVIDQVVGDFRGVLYTALAAVSLLMLIACCNVANMLLARATARQREMTVRAALGAGHWRIVRQLLVESLLLALAGAAAGCLLAYGGIKALVGFLPQGPLPGEVEFGLDGPALVFSLGVAAASALVFGIAPALYSARRDLVQGLRGDSKGVAGGRGGLRNALVAAEIALSLVLLLGAGLLMRSFMSLVHVDLGFDPRNILVISVAFAPGDYDAAADKQRFYAQALQRIASLPGVSAAAASTSIPPFVAGNTSAIEIPGRPDSQRSTALVQFCTEGYFRTVGVRFLRGRGSPAIAADEEPRTAVVNRTLVASYFGGADPLGKSIRLTVPSIGSDRPERRLFEIVGVVEDVKNDGIRTVPAPQVYLPGAGSTILVRTASDPLNALNAIRREIGAIDRSVALRQPDTLEELLRRFAYAQPRFSLVVLGVFAVTGTLLVAIGVFSVMAYTVSRQTREIAVRMALGAGRREVLGVVFGLGAQLLLAGVTIGVLASLASGRLIANQLWNTSPHDLPTLVAAISVIAVVALAACYLPAARAMRVDPMAALRHE
jgi:putative ABC transport system permease protein